MSNEKIEVYLAEIDRIIEEAKSLPFSNKISIDQDELVDIIQSIRENMPTEILQAKRVAQNSGDIIKKAERSAEEIIDKARQRADIMVEEHQITKEAKEASAGIMQAAKKDADDLIAAAKAEAQSIRQRADKYEQEVKGSAIAYVENALKQSESVLAESSQQIAKLRRSFETFVHDKKTSVYDAID